ncbi:MAG: NAD-dependent epimerase/dehydratase family protein [Elusimicrobia bacterium]|nr:NAD-dependent epimerase/dehydratase family protein [Elusimicrobiota bacterium]
MAETVLVTGATGFIGRALAARLTGGGIKVRCLARRGSDTRALKAAGMECAEGDLLDTLSLETAAAGASAVWHLGALVRPKGFLVSRLKLEKKFQTVNASGTENMARAAAAAGVKRFIYFSSVSAAGPGDNIKEEAEPRPLTAYGRSKLAGELALRRAAAETGLDFIILRPAMVYGPGAERWTALFKAVKAGLVPMPGGGDNIISICRLESLLDAAFLAAEKGASGSAFNISEGSIKLKDLASILAGLMGTKPVYLHLPTQFLGAAVKLADLSLGALGLALPRLNLLADYPCFKEACSNWSHDTSKLRALGWNPPDTRAALALTLKGGGFI